MLLYFIIIIINKIVSTKKDKDLPFRLGWVNFVY